MFLNFYTIIQDAWAGYDPSRAVVDITDISARVSTNHVFRLTLDDHSTVIAKLSYFGAFENFLEDHALINALAVNLPDPYDQCLSRALMKKNELYTYRYKSEALDAWVVFYNPIKKKQMLPKILNEGQIMGLGSELGRFHKTCRNLINVLPDWSKTIKVDTDHLKAICQTPFGQYEHRGNLDVINRQIDLLHENIDKLGANSWTTIPVFVDWNIGNFSVTEDLRFYSRWDYDWFRMSSRIMDFYFFSRVCSTIGDRTYFSYLMDPLQEDRFLLFLKNYHQEYPLTRNEIFFIPEAYRFFILNYVIKDGRYFFHEIYASRLQKEAYDTYLPQLDTFDADKILRALDL